MLAGPPHDDHARFRARELGAAAYLTTPLVVADLHRVVGRLGEAYAAAAGRARRRGVA